MSHDPHIEVIFDSETFRVSEFSCACDAPHKSGEEAASGHEIVFPQRGYFERRNSFGKSHADPTQVLFFNKAQPYEVKHPLGAGDVCTIFEVSETILKSFSDNPRIREKVHSGTPFQANHLSVGPETGLGMFQILKNSQTLSPWEVLGFEETVLDFLRTIFHRSFAPETKLLHPRKKQTLEAHAALVERAVRYLNQNFSRPLKLAEVARGVYSSPYHLCRVFRAQTGRTLHGYLSTLRIKAAVEALRMGSPSLTGLALDLGFSSHSHFSADFRKSLSLTPKSVRTLLAE